MQSIFPNDFVQLSDEIRQIAGVLHRRIN